MYLKSFLLVLLTILGSFDTWRVEALTVPPTSTPSLVQKSTTEAVIEGDEKDDQPSLPQNRLDSLQVYVVEQFDNRNPDGSYEFRYALSDNTVRYERGDIVHYHPRNILVVSGYYSYKLPDYRYLTVYYSADQNGYRQDSSSITTYPPHFHRNQNEKSNSTDAPNQNSGQKVPPTVNADKL